MAALSYVLDSTLIIDHSNGLPAAVDMMWRLFSGASDLYTCDAVTCEVLSGGSPAGREDALALLDALEYIALDPDGARWAGERRAERGPGASRSSATAASPRPSQADLHTEDHPWAGCAWCPSLPDPLP